MLGLSGSMRRSDRGLSFARSWEPSPLTADRRCDLGNRRGTTRRGVGMPRGPLARPCPLRVGRGTMSRELLYNGAPSWRPCSPRSSSARPGQWPLYRYTRTSYYALTRRSDPPRFFIGGLASNLCTCRPAPSVAAPRVRAPAPDPFTADACPSRALPSSPACYARDRRPAPPLGPLAYLRRPFHYTLSPRPSLRAVHLAPVRQLFAHGRPGLFPFGRLA